MTKEEYVNIIVCEYWFGFTDWEGRNWDDKKKAIWLSGMHRTWNILFPSDQIEPLEIYKKRTKWTREEAQQWYADYISDEEKDDGTIKNRWQILDLSEKHSNDE